MPGSPRMKNQDILRIIKVDDYSVTAKYLQIAHSIIGNITSGTLHKGDSLPSINELSYELDIARDTVERAYKYLRDKNVIDSVPRKGYFITDEQVKQDLKIFLLFNKLSEHKKIIYDSFVAALGNDVSIDFYIYNNDFSLFKKLIAEKNKDYTHYVILPHFVEGGAEAYKVINALPKEKLILLDKRMPEVNGVYGGVYENFEADIYNALKAALVTLKKYAGIKIIFPESSYYPDEIKTGTRQFCREFGFRYDEISDISSEKIEAGIVYISVMEEDLVSLIESIMLSGFVVGKDVGVISYNETRIKNLILDGITTVSTDFHALGAKAAELVLSGAKGHTDIPFRMAQRASL